MRDSDPPIGGLYYIQNICELIICFCFELNSCFTTPYFIKLFQTVLIVTTSLNIFYVHDNSPVISIWYLNIVKSWPRTKQREKCFSYQIGHCWVPVYNIWPCTFSHNKCINIFISTIFHMGLNIHSFVFENSSLEVILNKSVSYKKNPFPRNYQSINVYKS